MILQDLIWYSYMLFNYNFCLQEYLQREKYGSARLENFASGLELISQKVFYDIIVLYLLQLTSAVRLKGCFCVHFQSADEDRDDEEEGDLDEQDEDGTDASEQATGNVAAEQATIAP